MQALLGQTRMHWPQRMHVKGIRFRQRSGGESACRSAFPAEMSLDRKSGTSATPPASDAKTFRRVDLDIAVPTGFPWPSTRLGKNLNDNEPFGQAADSSGRRDTPPAAIARPVAGLSAPWHDADRDCMITSDMAFLQSENRKAGKQTQQRTGSRANTPAPEARD